MLGKLLFLFVVVPVLEMYLLFEIGTALGIGNTVAIIVVTGLIGTLLYRSQSQVNIKKIIKTVQQGIFPDREMFDHLLIIIGAVLLMTPGVLTDIAGFLLLIPFTRPKIRKGLKKYFKRKMGGNMKVKTIQPS